MMSFYLSDLHLYGIHFQNEIAIAKCKYTRFHMGWQEIYFAVYIEQQKSPTNFAFRFAFSECEETLRHNSYAVKALMNTMFLHAPD